jgi:hypothetical protein
MTWVEEQVYKGTKTNIEKGSPENTHFVGVTKEPSKNEDCLNLLKVKAQIRKSSLLAPRQR